MTDSFGARLRRERERRSINIAEVAARTKIKASLFEALERNDVSQWPAGLFRRSFIRAYADAVGLDAQATLVEFLQLFPDPADPSSGRPVDRQSRPAPFSTSATTAAVPQAADRAEVPATGGGAGSTELAAALRLTLADADLPFQAGRLIADSRTRWPAVACDVAVVFAVALVIFIVANRFWMPLGITALSYYIGGILFLGNSPGVCLLSPDGRVDEPRANEPARPARPRHTDTGRGRTPELPRNPFRAPPRRARPTRT